ncbi:Defensin-like protein [Medicago truncatula]|uniref:Defensin-like protein n=1 Tax=Medicago truncatula TaxID=3880 RepID=A0A072TMT6_MEDTR|nr:Defensin-like protein [Medicago truncatula]
MACSSTKFYTIFLFLSFALLLFSTMAVEACGKRSQTWSGPCFISENCRRQCINVEHGVDGNCKQDGLGTACFCC